MTNEPTTEELIKKALDKSFHIRFHDGGYFIRKLANRLEQQQKENDSWRDIAHNLKLDNEKFTVKLKQLQKEIDELKESKSLKFAVQRRKTIINLQAQLDQARELLKNNPTSHPEFLKWVADRLVHVHEDSPNVDFIHRLKRCANYMELALAALEPKS